MDLLKGKVALITGAGSGIGAEIATAFAREGAHVISSDANDDGAAETATTLKSEGLSCRAAHLDVTSEVEWDNVISSIGSEERRLDILVNNAGVSGYCPIEDTSTEFFMRFVMVNQLGVFLGIKSSIKLMRASGGGSIINMSSSSGLTGRPRMIAYGGTKWAVRGMTKTAAVELGPDNIRVNSLHPGMTNTPMLQKMSPTNVESHAARLPLRRLGTPGDAAAMALFLASDQSAYCTGSEFVVDGGFSTRA